MDRSEVKSTLQKGVLSLHSYDALKKLEYHVSYRGSTHTHFF